MIVTLLFLAVVAVIVAVWLSQQGLAAKPWLNTGPTGDVPDVVASPLSTAKLGLGVFLAVAGSLLALLVSAYVMRMDMEDWRPLPSPNLLWFNTAALVLSSVALHSARVAVRRDEIEGARAGMLVGGIAAVVFLVGQLIAWRQLAAAGYRPAANPADAFFYLITAIHGLHVLGGLAALASAGARLWRGHDMEKLRQSVELCATYWHFLLVVWLILFGLLAFSPSFLWLYAICSASFG